MKFNDILFLLAIILIVFVLGFQCHLDTKCKERGGTYLWHEWVCLDVKTLKD